MGSMRYIELDQGSKPRDGVSSPGASAGSGAAGGAAGADPFSDPFQDQFAEALAGNLQGMEVLGQGTNGDDLDIDSVVDLMLRQADPDALAFPELMPMIDPQDRPHLHSLYTQLVSQYLEPIAQFMHLIRREAKSTDTLEGFRNLLMPILQLTDTMDVAEQREIIQGFLDTLQQMQEHRGNFTYRQLEPLNELFDQLLNSLGQQIREQYLATCYYKRNSNPLLEEIRRVKYIGPKRLQRLYAVGLVTVEAISKATAQEIVEVTGLPLKLAEQVIEVTRAFMVQERANRKRRLVALCDELGFELKRLTDLEHELVKEITPTFESLDQTLRSTLTWLHRPHHDRHLGER